MTKSKMTLTGMIKSPIFLGGIMILITGCSVPQKSILKVSDEEAYQRCINEETRKIYGKTGDYTADDAKRMFDNDTLINPSYQCNPLPQKYYPKDYRD